MESVNGVLVVDDNCGRCKCRECKQWGYRISSTPHIRCPYSEKPCLECNKQAYVARCLFSTDQESKVCQKAHHRTSDSDWRRFELCFEDGPEKDELYRLLDRLELSRRELALIVLGLRARPGFELKDFDI